tara:strand:+ start:434 stop:730 length:297 start_codon:yes stop_codon:yes gene_type:complete
MTGRDGLSLKDVERMASQGWSKAESYGINMKDANEGIKWNKYAIKKQNTRNRQIRDIVNIGAGTRCRHCGMLHMCWLPKCGACGLEMDYNLGKVDDTQ